MSRIGPCSAGSGTLRDPMGSPACLPARPARARPARTRRTASSHAAPFGSQAPRARAAPRAAHVRASSVSPSVPCRPRAVLACARRGPMRGRSPCRARAGAGSADPSASHSRCKSTCTNLRARLLRSRSPRRVGARRSADGRLAAGAIAGARQRSARTRPGSRARASMRPCQPRPRPAGRAPRSRLSPTRDPAVLRHGRAPPPLCDVGRPAVSWRSPATCSRAGPPRVTITPARREPPRRSLSIKPRLCASSASPLRARPRRPLRAS